MILRIKIYFLKFQARLSLKAGAPPKSQKGLNTRLELTKIGNRKLIKSGNRKLIILILMFRGRNQDAGVTDDKRFVEKLQEVALVCARPPPFSIF